MNKYKILSDNSIVITGSESKYQKKYRMRKALSRQVNPDSEKVLTIPELKSIGVIK